MTKITSVWEVKEHARSFLKFERSAVPGAELQLAIIGTIAQHWCDNPLRVLDLGCGDGILGRFLLNRFPGASGVFLDFSDTMLEAARESLSDNPESTVLKADFASPKWLDTIAAHKPFEIVVSGFAIHHQPDERKKELYSEIYNLLSRGGIFLNLEHVESRTPEVEKLFEEFYIDHLYNYHVKSDPGATREAVAEGYGNRPDKKEDKLASADTQCRWLREIGFSDVDCFFKVFEIALFGGRRK
jgi:ubiquinone/menaquinone biosynthesis C-methylase UbiE